jgi:hypothetical protein
VTPAADAVSGPATTAGRSGGVPWSRVLGLVVLLVLAFVASRSCQQAGIRIDKERAIATAQREVDFTPTHRQVRLLRQGLGSKPFWIVSLSVPVEGGEGFRRLAVVRVDANSGKVVEVREGRNVPEGQRLRERSSDGG